MTDGVAVATTVAILDDAIKGAVTREESPTLVADAGVENVNSGVDGLIETGLLRRVLALREVTCSNSMIEAWWRTLTHQWLFLNTQDNVSAVRRLVDFYVAAHARDSSFGIQRADGLTKCTAVEVTGLQGTWRLQGSKPGRHGCGPIKRLRAESAGKQRR